MALLRGLICWPVNWAARVSRSVAGVCLSAARWDSSTPSAIYIILTNSIFWYIVLCVDPNGQAQLLYVSMVFLLIDVVIFPVLQLRNTLSIARLNRMLIIFDNSVFRAGCRTSSSLKSLKNTPASDVRRSTALLFLKALSQFICIFFYNLLSKKKVETVFLACLALTLKMLYDNRLFDACCIAYATLLLWLVVPPWCHYKVNYVICKWSSRCLCTFVNSVNGYLVQPVRCFIASACDFLGYVLLFKWLWPLFGQLRSLVNPVIDSINWAVDGFIYCAMGHWIPPLYGYVSGCARSACTRLLSAIVYAYSNLIYAITLQWVRPLASYLLACCKSIFQGTVVKFCLFIMAWTRQKVATVKSSVVRPICNSVAKRCRFYYRLSKLYFQRAFSIIFYALALCSFVTCKYFFLLILSPVFDKLLQCVNIVTSRFSEKYGSKIRDACEAISKYGDQLKDHRDDEINEFVPDEDETGILDNVDDGEEEEEKEEEGQGNEGPPIFVDAISSDSSDFETFLPEDYSTRDALDVYDSEAESREALLNSSLKTAKGKRSPIL